MVETKTPSSCSWTRMRTLRIDTSRFSDQSIAQHLVLTRGTHDALFRSLHPPKSLTCFPGSTWHCCVAECARVHASCNFVSRDRPPLLPFRPLLASCGSVVPVGFGGARRALGRGAIADRTVLGWKAAAVQAVA